MPEQKNGSLLTMLNELQSDYNKGAAVNFRAMGWRLQLNAEGPDLYRARLVNTNGTLLVDQRCTTLALAKYVAMTILLDKRKMDILSAQAVAEAEKLLA